MGNRVIMGNAKKHCALSVTRAALIVLAAGALVFWPQKPAGMAIAATDSGNTIAISVDGMTPMPEIYEIPVGSEQGFSVLSMSSGSPAGLVRTGEAEWSLATDANATLEAVPGEFVATVHADAPGEAGLYVATPDGASDMVTLLFTELKAAGSAKNDGPSSVTVVQPAGGSVVYVPDAEATALPLVAETNAPDATKSVVFTWPNSVAPLASFEDSSGAPFWATVPEINGINTVEVEALGKDGAAPVTGRGSWVMATATDSNRDGFPDAPFELNLTAGDMWHYSPAGPGGLNVVMAGLPSAHNEPSEARDSDAFSVFVHGAVGLYEVRVARNLLDEHETGILVIGEAPEPTTLLNRDLAASLPPIPAEAEALLSSVLFVDILVQRDGSAAWASIGDRLAEDPLEVKAYKIPGLSAATNARLYSLDVLVADSHSPSGPHIVIPPGAAWRQSPEGAALESEMFSTKLRAPALMGLFQTGHLINITNINNVGIGGAQDYAIGGGVIEITVENLGGVSTTDLGITIGGQAAAVSSVAGNVVTAVVPRAADLEAPAAKTAVDIGIEIAGTGEFDAIPNGFTYLGPEVASITPVHGPSTGGTDVILAGNGFDANGTVVSFDGAPVLVDSVTPNTVAGVTSAGNPGTADLEVLTANNFRDTEAHAFTYTPPPPVLTDVTPGQAPTSAQSTLRVEGSFFDMSTGSEALNGYLRAFFDTDVANPATNSEAAYVTFRDKSHIDVVTPSGPPAGATGLFVRATVLDESASFTTTSNVLPFSFVDGTQAEMAIRGVMPAAGPLSGGNVIRIIGSNFPPAAGEFTNRGNVIRVGRVATEGENTVEVPVCLYRAPDASAGPSAMRFSLGFETSMLSYTSHIVNPVLETEYGKSVVCNVSENSLGVLIFGGTEAITLENEPNPFELFRLTFEVAGNPGESAVFPVHDLSMAGPSGANIPDAYGDAGVVTVGDNLSLPEPPQVSFGPNTARVIGATNSTIQVIAPAGVRLGTVDVLVQDADPSTPDNIAVYPAFEGKGYTYIPEGGLRVSRVVASQNNGTLPPEGGRVILAGQGFRNVFALTLMFADGAMVALDGESDYVVNNDGRITLTIAPGRLEELRKNVGLKDRLPGGPVTLMLETAAGAATIENAFVVGAETTEMTVSDISPDGAWVIGGLVAEIVGQNFGAPESMTAAFEYTAPSVKNGPEKTDVLETVTIPLEILTGPGYPNNSTKLYVQIPPLPGVDDAWPASVAMNRLVVTKERAEETALEDGETGSPFTYYRWKNAGGVTTTAFYYENASGAEDREIVLDNDEADNATLSIPPLDNRFFDKNTSREPDRVHVLARAARDAAALGATGLTELPGEDIPEAWTFDIHLYTDAAAKALLPPANNRLYEEISPEFEVPLNTDGTQIEPARLTIPTARTPLTVGDVRSGTISVQTQPSALDDLSAPALASASIPEATSKHCSTILDSFNGVPEFAPNPATAADDQLVEKVMARLYSFGAVSLRRGAAAVPEPVLTSASTAEGPVAGGTEIVLFGRDLGWVESVEFGGDGKAVTKASILDGNNEFAVRVRSPKVTTPGPVDIQITTATGKAAVLKNAFTYKANEETVSLFLGLIVALIGIFSGGKGGSGGGPCFIATAAYGTSLEGDIEVLRTVRDTYLLNNAVGTAFVDAYYTVSPELAGAVAKSPLLSALARIALVPLIALCRLVLAMPHFVFGAIMLSMVGVAVRRVRRRLRKT